MPGRLLNWITRRSLRKGDPHTLAVAKSALHQQSLARKAQATRELNSTWQILPSMTMFKDKDANGNWGTLDDLTRAEVYSKHALVHACVSLICAAYRKAPLSIGDYDNKGVFRANSLGWNHPVLRLLRRPNPAMTQTDFFTLDIARLLLTGKSYVWKWRNSLDQVSELWPVPSHWVTPVPLKTMPTTPTDTRRVISHYLVAVPGRSTPYTVAARDMVDRRFVDPACLLDGVAPLDAARRRQKLDSASEDYFNDLLSNMFVPGPVLTQEEEPSTDQMAELRAAFLEKVGGEKRFSPLILWGKGAGITTPAPLSDLDWAGFAAMNESQICAAFGTPPLLVHARVAQENTPLSDPSLGAASRVFYENTMTALWLYSAEAWSAALLWQEGMPELHLIHDLRGVDALRENRQQVAHEVSLAVRNSAMSLADAQRRLGLDPSPELEGVYLVQAGVSIWRPATEKTPPPPASAAKGSATLPGEQGAKK